MGNPLTTRSGTSNNEESITIAAIDSTLHTIELTSVGCSYTGSPTAGKLTIESPSGTILQQWDVNTTVPQNFEFPGGLKGAKGQAVVVRLAAAGTGCVGSVNAVQRD